MNRSLFTAAFALGLSLPFANAPPKELDVSKLPPPAARQGVTYAADIKPILEKACVKCHGPEKQKINLRLDSLAVVLKGGNKGPVIVPGDSVRSTLFHNVARREAKGELTRDEIGLVRAWIDQGAK